MNANFFSDVMVAEVVHQMAIDAGVEKVRQLSPDHYNIPTLRAL